MSVKIKKVIKYVSEFLYAAYKRDVTIDLEPEENLSEFIFLPNFL